MRHNRQGFPWLVLCFMLTMFGKGYLLGLAAGCLSSHISSAAFQVGRLAMLGMALPQRAMHGAL